MAKNRRQWNKFRVENRKSYSHTFYDLQVDIGVYPNDNKWVTLASYDYFRNARGVARRLDAAFKL